MSYQPGGRQVQPDHTATPQVPQRLSTPYTTPLASSQTAPQPNELRGIRVRGSVRGIRIPGEGLHIERLVIPIGTNHCNECLPLLGAWWGETTDPTVQPFVRTTPIQIRSFEEWSDSQVLSDIVHG